MSDTSHPPRCPKCGQPIPEQAPQGLCPKCVLLQASIPTEGATPRPAPSRQEIAAAFPQLEILELIGQGGMGFVFKARQPKLERLVALKILPQALATDPAFAERFTREGRALARLSHPNIVAIHDFGQVGGFFYLLMEYVDGVNLRQAMRAGRFTPAQALAVVPKICEALQFAHNEGILHRDIKPENILLDAKGRVKIADFGIAKLVGETQSEVLTGSGGTLGTPHYMAPEQLEKPGTVDHRADIYSLGVVFYEMLTGELPLGRFQPPSQKVEMDVRLDEVVLHALEKEPSRRYQQVSHVKTAVETISGASPPAVTPAADHFWRRMVMAMAVLCLTLIAFMAWFAKSFLESQKAMKASQAAAAQGAGPEKALATMVIDTKPFEPWRWAISPHAREMSVWEFNSLIPAGHLAQLVFLVWTKGMPTVIPGLSSYLKVGQNPFVLGDSISCYPEAAGPHGETNIVQWNISGLSNLTVSVLLSNQPPLHQLETAPRSVLHSGHQLVLRLAEFPQRAESANSNWSGVELRIILSPLPSPAAQTDPNEFVGTDYVGGYGLGEASEDSILKLIEELPCESAVGEPSANSPPKMVMNKVEPANLVIESVKPLNGLIWGFDYLIPADHLMQLVFVLWNNGIPSVEPGLSGYFKVGHQPAVFKGGFGGTYWSCGPNVSDNHQGNVVNWNLMLCDNRMAPAWISNQPPYHILEAPPRSVLHSGQQLAIRLAESDHLANSNEWSGVEIRWILQPLRTPVIQAEPNESVGSHWLSGFGLSGISRDAMLRLIKELPSEPPTAE